MKLDRHQIRLIIGLTFIAVMFIVIYFLELKMNNQNKAYNEYERSKINEVNFSDATQRY